MHSGALKDKISQTQEDQAHTTLRFIMICSPPSLGERCLGPGDKETGGDFSDFLAFSLYPLLQSRLRQTILEIQMPNLLTISVNLFLIQS